MKFKLKTILNIHLLFRETQFFIYSVKAKANTLRVILLPFKKYN